MPLVEALIVLLLIVVNGVLDPLFTPAEREALLQDPALLEYDAPAKAAGTRESAVVAGARRAIREQIQAESIARMRRDLPLPAIELPFLFEEASTAAGTRILASLL